MYFNFCKFYAFGNVILYKISVRVLVSCLFLVYELGTTRLHRVQRPKEGQWRQWNTYYSSIY